MLLIPGTTELLRTKALLGFARFRFGLDNTHVCHFCLVHKACCLPQCHPAHIVPRAVLQMDPFQAGCRSLWSSPDSLTVLTFEVK